MLNNEVRNCPSKVEQRDIRVAGRLLRNANNNDPVNIEAESWVRARWRLPEAAGVTDYNHGPIRDFTPVTWQSSGRKIIEYLLVEGKCSVDSTENRN